MIAQGDKQRLLLCIDYGVTMSSNLLVNKEFILHPIFSATFKYNLCYLLICFWQNVLSKKVMSW
ncbi:MAG: hypothetical protein DRN20_01780 [Thermoplasmata archaeon]|nr:MAG: hypothetical protein DRN20_01780 [Thermoplasmata archaeon]